MALAQALARRRTYYGWYIAGLVFVTNLTFGGIGNFSPAVFLKPMTTELDWSRTFFSMTVSLGVMAISPVAFLIGPLVDKRGARLPMLAGGLMLGAGIMALGFVQTQWQFIAVRGMLVPLGIAGLSQMSPTVAISNWFVKKRGRVLGITTMGLATGSVLITPVATFLIETLGWRQAWVVLGLAAWLMVLAPVALIMKRRPEDVGLLPDGEVPSGESSQTRGPARSDVTWTRREAIRTPALWLLAFGIPLGMMGMGAVNAHFYSYLTDKDFTPQTTAWIVMTISAVSLIIKPPWGFVSERVNVRYCLVATFIIISVGMAMLALMSPGRLAMFVTAAVLGLGWGGILPLQALIWANFYGRMSLGRVQSTLFPVQAVLGAVGPIAAGRVYDVMGSYKLIFLVFIATEAAAATLILLAKPPRKPGQGGTGAPGRAAAQKG